MLKRGNGIRRNDRCICGSGKKFKYCCHPQAARQPHGASARQTHYIDTGEVPVRYVITDFKGTGFFSSKENKIIVFQNRADAIAIATLDDFAAAEAGEINVAGVGETKWKRLQEKIPFVEVASAEEAAELVRERMDHMRALIEAAAAPPSATNSDETVAPANPEGE